MRELCDRAMAEGRCTFAHVLLEEMLEMFEALCNAPSVDEVLAEAVQVAAVLVKLIEYIHTFKKLADTGDPAVYIAAPLGEYRTARDLAGVARGLGFVVASTWHDTVDGSVETSDPARRKALAATCVKELGRADAVLAWTARGTPRATLSEIGYALAFGKPVLWMQGPAGAGGNVFDASRHVTVVRVDRDDWWEAFRQLRLRLLEQRR